MKLSPKHTAPAINIFTMMTNLAREEQACNLSQGLPDYPVAPELNELLQEAVLTGHNQYAPMQGLLSLRTNISAVLNKKYHTTFCSPEIVTITPGATYGIYTALAAIVTPGDEVIYLEPAFDCYLPAIEMNGAIPINVELDSTTHFSINWEKIENAITSKTKAILINTPHNPTGYVWKQEDWNQLASLINGKNIYVISDEVYDNIVFDGKLHIPGFLQSIFNEKIISIYSFGKTFHITGWKVGYCIASKELTEAFRAVHQYLSFSVNTPAQYALAKYLEIYEPHEAAQLLEAKRNILIEGLQQSNLRQLAVSEGTYFQLYDYSEISDLDDVAFAKWLTTKYKVATIPLSAFYKKSVEYKMIRLCFAKKDEVIHKAVSILKHL